MIFLRPLSLIPHSVASLLPMQVRQMMDELDTNKDGLVSWPTFSEWNRRNSMEAELWKQVATVEDELRKQLRELGQRPRA